MNIPDFIDWLQTDECRNAIEADEDFAENIRQRVEDSFIYGGGGAIQARRLGNAVECTLFQIYDAWRDEQEAEEHPAKAASDNIDAQERAAQRSER